MCDRTLHRHAHRARVMRTLFALSIGLHLGGLPGAHSLGAFIQPIAPDPAAIRQPIRAALTQTDSIRSVPLSFESNQGQTDPRVDFIARGPGYTAFLMPDHAVVTLHRAAGLNNSASIGKTHAAVLRVGLIGTSAVRRGEGVEKLAGKVNYLRGKHPAGWRTEIPTYSKVRYASVYPGIDLVYYGAQRQLEYDFIVHPRADPERIVLALEGADRMEIDPEGNLLLHMQGGSIRQRKPVIYQEVDGARRQIAGGYVRRGAHEIGFDVAAYDTSRPLIIDPVLSYSTYLGAALTDEGAAITVDVNGNMYIAGRTSSADFPTTAGAFQTAFTGMTDAFVAKLDAAGALVYSTYLGGAGKEEARGIAVDAAGNAYVIGDTTSVDFPITPGAFRTTAPGLLDGFVAKLDAAGSALVYSTYLGGAGEEESRGVAIDSVGSTYVFGDTKSVDFPTTAGAFQRTGGGLLSDAFVTKLDAAGSALVYSTYLGGSGEENGLGIALDGSGNAYVTGDTTSTNFPSTVGAFQTALAAFGDAYVTKLSADGATLVYSTYLGGSKDDRGSSVAVDANGNAYIGGRTESTNFPVTAARVQGTLAGLTDCIVTKLNATGSALVYSTYLGGSRIDEFRGIAVDASGNAYAIGHTASADFPTTAGGLQATLAGAQDLVLSKFNATGSALVYSTLLGGTGDEFGRGIALDAAASAYVTGVTFSADFPTTAGAFDSTANGLEEAFVAKIQ